MPAPHAASCCPTRRAFLADVGMGFTGLALGAMLARDGVVRADEGRWSPPDGPGQMPRLRRQIPRLMGRTP